MLQGGQRTALPTPTLLLVSQVEADQGGRERSSTRWIEREERQGQAWAINYLGRGGGWGAGMKETRERRARGRNMEMPLSQQSGRERSPARQSVSVSLLLLWPFSVALTACGFGLGRRNTVYMILGWLCFC